MSEPDDRTPRWVLPFLFLLLFGLVLGMVWIRVRPKTGALEIEVHGFAEQLEIFVDGRKACDASPCLVEGLPPGEHQIRARSADGSAANESAVVAARKRIRVMLSLEPGSPTHRSDPGNVIIEPIPAVEEEPQPSTPALPTIPEPETPPTPISPSEPLGQSTLNLNSIPIASIMIDGKAVGQTPKMGLVVPPGKHLVSFVHPQLGTKIVSVVVGPGEMKTIAVKLQ